MPERLTDPQDALTHDDTIGIAKAAILTMLGTKTPLTGRDLQAITTGDSRLSQDDTVVAVTQLSAEGVVHRIPSGISFRA